MYEVTYSANGIIHKTNIPADDYTQVFNIMINMFGSGNFQIISARRI